MKTLILYSTTDGQTKKIAEFIGTHLDGEVVVQSITESQDLAPFDRIMIGASIRYGHFNKVLYAFVNQHQQILEQKSAVFFGVNLTARKIGKDTPEGNAYIRKFLQKVKWQPHFAGVFAGALFYPRYKWFDRIMIQFIMKLTGGETDPTKEIEYTDWEKVTEFAQRFNSVNR